MLQSQGSEKYDGQRIPAADLDSTGSGTDIERITSTFGAALDETAICLGNFSFPQKSVAVVGNEGNGISRPVLDACQQTLYIPMKGETESLNAGVAASLILWEMCR